jgi:hypothetical protein
LAARRTRLGGRHVRRALQAVRSEGPRRLQISADVTQETESRLAYYTARSEVPDLEIA